MRAGRPIFMLLMVVAIAASILGSRGLSSVLRAATPAKVYLPLAIKDGPHSSFLGFETNTRTLGQPHISVQARGLNAKWVRLNTVSWREIQPTPERVYNWDAAAGF